MVALVIEVVAVELLSMFVERQGSAEIFKLCSPTVLSPDPFGPWRADPLTGS